VRLRTAGSDELDEGVGIVAAIGNDVAALQTSQQIRCGTQVVGLAGRQHNADRQAILIDEGVDLGTQSATRAADGVILAPFLPPAACWWARMIELSMSAIECGDLADNVSKTRTQTPALAQRL